MAHGSGLKFEVEASRSESFQGAYGRIGPKADPWQPSLEDGQTLEDALLKIADRMTEAPSVPPEANERTRLEAVIREGGSRIPAGYTYFGQFIDHDVTFDPASSQMRHRDPSGARNFRTPRLDLDSVYGRGPEDQPYLYDQRDGEQGKLIIGKVEGSELRDLPRNDRAQGRALIGDPRNDENAIVSQLHLAFLLAHNTLVERAKERGKPKPFEAACRTLRFLYQYVVWHDFLARVTTEAVRRRALQPAGSGWTLGFDKLYDWERQQFMPVEFSAAAYRFGHSMVRNEYRTNALRGAFEFVPLFDPRNRDDLRGRRPMTKDNVIQWGWFLDMGLPQAELGFPQQARRIDTKLASALARLPQESAPRNVLAFRNLERSTSFALPTGTAMAKAVAKTYPDSGIAPMRLDDEPDALWYYILLEAERTSDPGDRSRLGPLGSAIVCATFASLLKSDPDSYLNAGTPWTPGNDLLLFAGEDNIDGEKASEQGDRDRSWTLASIVRISGLPVDSADIHEQHRGEFRNPARHR